MSKKVINGPLAALKLAQIVAFDGTLGNTAKKTFTIIAGYANEAGICWPSVTKIAQELGVTRAAVSKQLKILENHGYLIREERYDSKTGRRRTNIIQLNLILANTYLNNPAVLSKRNREKKVTAPETIESYGGMQPNIETIPVTSISDINITPENKQKEKNREDNIMLLTPQSIAYANSWEDEKERELFTGITPKHKRELANLCDELKKYKNCHQMVALDLSMNRQAKEQGLNPLEKIEYITSEYQKILNEEIQKSKTSNISKQ